MRRYLNNEFTGEFADGLGEFEFESEAEFESVLTQAADALYESPKPRAGSGHFRTVFRKPELKSPTHLQAGTIRTGEGKIGPVSISALNCETGHLLYNFDINSAALKPAHQRFLQERIVEVLWNASNVVDLIGRASRFGSSSDNQRLSEKRVQAVANFLRRAGVANQQINIQAIGSQSPFSLTQEAEEDRAVEVRPRITRVLTLALRNVGIVPRANVVIQTIRQTLEPLVSQGGRELKIVRSVNFLGDLTLTFDPGGGERSPCAPLILGEGGAGDISIAAHRDLKVCSGMVLDAQGRPDHQAQLQHVFQPDEPAFARAIANTVLHELGHMMAKLPHVNNPNNVMHSVGIRGANIPNEHRTRARMRQLFGGRKGFSADQARLLVCAIQTGFYSGVLTTARVRGPATLNPPTTRRTAGIP